MNDETLATNYIRAFEHLVGLLTDAEAAILLADADQDQLGLKQYRHLKQDYVHQLADLISRAPHSVRLQAVPH